MKSFFAPATALIGRFSYSGMFMLIGLVFAIPIGLMLARNVDQYKTARISEPFCIALESKRDSG